VPNTIAQQGRKVRTMERKYSEMVNRDSNAYRDHHEAIRQEYKKQAPSWATKEISSDLLWVVDHLNLQPHYVALDVAAGTGLLGRAISPHVSQVVASDITEEMLAQGREETARDGTTNFRFEQGTAEDLLYPDASFDVVVTRFSVHHFIDPAAVVSEMSRVCRPGGKVAVVDMVAPQSEKLALRYNDLERLRDLTHTQALTVPGLNQLVGDAGLDNIDHYSREGEVNASNWLDSAQVEPAKRKQILAALNADLEGSSETGLRPFTRDGELMFRHTWEMVVAEKPTE